MAKYKRRPKVKRYRRSFYSRGMRIRKIVGIVVLVAVVLAAAWFAARTLSIVTFIKPWIGCSAIKSASLFQ